MRGLMSACSVASTFAAGPCPATLDCVDVARPSLLAVYVSCGSGHRRAAQAVVAAARERGIDAESVNLLDHVHPLFRRFYQNGYEWTVRHAPALWAGLYASAAHPRSEAVLRSIQAFLSRPSARPFFDLIEASQPSTVVATHFLAVHLLGPLRARYGFRLAAAITDFEAHPFWIDAAVDTYTVAHEDVARELEALGVPRDKIEVTGIPIQPDLDRLDPAACRQALGIPEDERVILVLSGGIGVGRIEQVVTELARRRVAASVWVSAGNDAGRRRQLEALASSLPLRVHAFGFVDNIEDYLGSADVLVTKPGGLTVSEALARRLPTVLIDPIPGQEEANARFLASRGAALRADGAAEAAEAALRLLGDPGLRSDLRRRMESLARPNAAPDAVKRLFPDGPEERQPRGSEHQ
jgi:processive 1,2-diacylglycerol beta-glucosyltransferase